MRLIDADALNNEYYKNPSYANLCKAINNAPIIDAVPVVRCEDCKHYVIEQLKSDYAEDKRYKPSVCIKGEFAVHRKPDWFCKDGERRAE